MATHVRDIVAAIFNSAVALPTSFFLAGYKKKKSSMEKLRWFANQYNRWHDIVQRHRRSENVVPGYALQHMPVVAFYGNSGEIIRALFDRSGPDNVITFSDTNQQTSRKAELGSRST